MFRNRASRTSACARITDWARSDQREDDASAPADVVIAHAIHDREVEGLTTTLRQLHKITRLSQPEALKAADELQKEGLIEVEPELHDALESRVRLSDALRKQFARGDRRNAA